MEVRLRSGHGEARRASFDGGQGNGLVRRETERSEAGRGGPKAVTLRPRHRTLVGWEYHSPLRRTWASWHAPRLQTSPRVLRTGLSGALSHRAVGLRFHLTLFLCIRIPLGHSYLSQERGRTNRLDLPRCSVEIPRCSRFHASASSGNSSLSLYIPSPLRQHACEGPIQHRQFFSRKSDNIFPCLQPYYVGQGFPALRRHRQKTRK